VVLVPGAIKQRDGTFPAQRAQLIELPLVFRSFELRVISALELLPASWIMSKPLPQLSRWSKLAEPEVKLQTIFGDPARPDPIDQDSLADGAGSGAVYALNTNFHSGRDC